MLAMDPIHLPGLSVAAVAFAMNRPLKAMVFIRKCVQLLIRQWANALVSRIQ
jgi:hypothetical protein